MGCVLDELSTDGAQYSSKVASGREVAGAVKSLVNARVMQLDFAKVLHETLFVPVLMYGVRQCYEKRRDLDLGCTDV